MKHNRPAYGNVSRVVGTGQEAGVLSDESSAHWKHSCVRWEKWNRLKEFWGCCSRYLHGIQEVLSLQKQFLKWPHELVN